MVLALLFMRILEQGNNLYSSRKPNWDCHRFTKWIKPFDFQLKDHLGLPLAQSFYIKSCYFQFGIQREKELATAVISSMELLARADADKKE